MYICAYVCIHIHMDVCSMHVVREDAARLPTCNMSEALRLFRVEPRLFPIVLQVLVGTLELMLFVRSSLDVVFTRPLGCSGQSHQHLLSQKG